MRAPTEDKLRLTGTIHIEVRAVPALNLAAVTYEITCA